MYPTPVTAVFDIGKTNKKYLLFDQELNLAHKEVISPDESSDEDGFECENLSLLVPWMKEQLEWTLASGNFDLKGLNVSAYGASFMHLGKDRQPVTPLYNYLKPLPSGLTDEFFDTHGPVDKWATDTASPPMGMLNSGLQLYWLKKCHPSTYNSIERSLHFPNWLMSIFGKSHVSEMTSIGCHTGLWDFSLGKYHQWLSGESLLHLFPDIQPVTETSMIQIDGQPIKAGTGIHDSSAALAPYLYGIEEPFILLSTGTWTIALNPFNSEALTWDDLRRDCLSYYTIQGTSVKASRFFLGNEYEHQNNRLISRFGTTGDDSLNPKLLHSLLTDDNQQQKLQLETAWATGPFPELSPGHWDLSGFTSYEMAHHQLLLDLVSIQAEAVRLAAGKSGVQQLVVTGGFSQNQAFLTLLATMLPEFRIYTDSLSHASALGAALVINNDTSNATLAVKKRMNLTLHRPVNIAGLDHYRWHSTQEQTR